MCEINCEYNGINYSRNTIICKCDVKTEINTKNDDPFQVNQMVIDTFKGSNLAVIKCYGLVFDFRNKFNNLGFFIFFRLSMKFPFKLTKDSPLTNFSISPKS